MPSNAMKISQLVSFLQNELAAHGDIDCVLQVSEMGATCAVDGTNVNTAIQTVSGRMPAPALVFGISRDESGALSNTPGPQYLATADGLSDWNHDRDAAPEDTDVAVWRRFKGADVGRRVGTQWFVYDDGASLIECVPQGILGWRLQP